MCHKGSRKNTKDEYSAELTADEVQGVPFCEFFSDLSNGNLVGRIGGLFYIFEFSTPSRWQEEVDLKGRDSKKDYFITERPTGIRRAPKSVSGSEAFSGTNKEGVRANGEELTIGMWGGKRAEYRKRKFRKIRKEKKEALRRAGRKRTNNVRIRPGRSRSPLDLSCMNENGRNEKWFLEEPEYRELEAQTFAPNTSTPELWARRSSSETLYIHLQNTTREHKSFHSYIHFNSFCNSYFNSFFIIFHFEFRTSKIKNANESIWRWMKESTKCKVHCHERRRTRTHLTRRIRLVEPALWRRP